MLCKVLICSQQVVRLHRLWEEVARQPSTTQASKEVETMFQRCPSPICEAPITTLSRLICKQLVFSRNSKTLTWMCQSTRLGLNLAACGKIESKRCPISVQLSTHRGISMRIALLIQSTRGRILQVSQPLFKAEERRFMVMKIPLSKRYNKAILDLLEI